MCSQGLGCLCQRLRTQKNAGCVEVDLLGKACAGVNIGRYLDGWREQAAETVAGSGGEQHHLGTRCDETGEGFGRIEGLIHKPTTGTVRRLSMLDQTYDRACACLLDGAKRFLFQRCQPSSDIGRPGIVADQIYPRGCGMVHATGYSRANGVSHLLGNGAFFQMMLRAEPLHRFASDKAAALRGDVIFHDAIVTSTGNRPLIALQRRMFLQARLFRRQSLATESGLADRNEDHRHMLEAFRKGDGEAAGKLSEEHVLRSKARFVNNLNKADGPSLDYD